MHSYPPPNPNLCLALYTSGLAVALVISYWCRWVYRARLKRLIQMLNFISCMRPPSQSPQMLKDTSLELAAHLTVAQSCSSLYSGFVKITSHIVLLITVCSGVISPDSLTVYGCNGKQSPGTEGFVVLFLMLRNPNESSGSVSAFFFSPNTALSCWTAVVVCGQLAWLELSHTASRRQR